MEEEVVVGMRVELRYSGGRNEGRAELEVVVGMRV